MGGGLVLGLWLWSGPAGAVTLTGGDYGGADLVPNDGDVLSGTFTNVGRFVVRAGTTVQVARGVPLAVHAGAVAVLGVLDGDGAGYAGGLGSDYFYGGGTQGSGPGGGGRGWAQGYYCNQTGSGGGAGHATAGGSGAGGQFGGVGGRAYGLPGDPADLPMGSGGGGGSGNRCGSVGGDGGAGGASIALYAVGSLVIEGIVRARGESARPGWYVFPGGGGSGGTVLLDAHPTAGTGHLDLSGGTGGGSGARGRLKVVGTMASTAALTWTAGSELIPAGLQVGGPATLVAGSPATFVATGADPGETVVLAGALSLTGVTRVPGCPGLSVPSGSPSARQAATADGAGQALFNVVVPAALAGRQVSLEVVTLGSCQWNDLSYIVLP